MTISNHHLDDVTFVTYLYRDPEWEDRERIRGDPQEVYRKRWAGRSRGNSRIWHRTATGLGPHTYVVEALSLGYVKIGYCSGNLFNRLNNLQVAIPVPLSLRLVFPGRGLELEGALHRRFAPLRAHGEWFYLEGDLARWISALRAQGSNPITRVFPDE